MFLSQLSEPLARAAGIKGSAFRVHRAQESGAKGIVKFFQRHCINPFESTYKHSLPRKESCTQECNQNKKKQKNFSSEGRLSRPSKSKPRYYPRKRPDLCASSGRNRNKCQANGEKETSCFQLQKFQEREQDIQKGIRKKRKHPVPIIKGPRSANSIFKKESGKKKASCTHHQRSQEREQDIQKGIKKKKKASCTHHQKSQKRKQDI